MKTFLAKTSTKIIIGVILIGAAFFGVFKYVEYRFDLLAGVVAQSKDNLSEADQKIAELEATLAGTQSTVTSALDQAEVSNRNLKDQVNEMTNTVGALEKLSTTDPELLKKYSKVYFLNEHYVPISLSDIPAEDRSKSSTNFQFHSDALPYLEKMIEAANDEDGLSLLAQSAYRSFAAQSVLKANYKVIYGAGTANSFSADQGYSEHQLGTTLDFTTGKTAGALEGFDKTPEYKWLLDNAYQYGFVISYPANNAYYKYEPWHWRFVGVALATRLHDDKTYFYGMDQRIIDTYLAQIFD
ncbi:MAG: M15 family metallopeptidase [bacterium]